MARCDEGYLCDVCGEEVASIVDSDLYLRFVLRMVEYGQLVAARERHLRCNPALSQFIDHPAFEAPIVEGPLGRAELDVAWVAEESRRVTAGYRRLREVVRLRLPIGDYPIGESGNSSESAGV